jgi:hypothetical protein
VLYQASAPIREIAVMPLYNGLTRVVVAFEDKVVILTTNDSGEFCEEPEQISGMEVVNMIFLPDARIVLACNQEIFAYDLYDGIDLKLQWETKTESKVIAVFAGPNRDQIGVLESNGKITLHNIKES